MRRPLTAAVIPLIVAWTTLTVAPAAAQEEPGLTVVVEPADASVDLGQSVDLTVTLTNTGSDPVADLTAHLDVTQLGKAGSVDPEDWTATLSRPVGELAAGTSLDVAWTVQPISPGDFILYAVALAPGRSDVAASDVMAISVADRRSLNPQGVLPAVVGVPVLLGLLLAERMRRDRRRR